VLVIDEQGHHIDGAFEKCTWYEGATAHIDPQTFPSVWLSSFFRLNFTILPKGLLFVLMSFIFSTWVHSLFQLNFPAIPSDLANRL
jgi:hypothetical protein